MHKSSMDNMKEFLDKYLSKDEKVTVVDVGAADINGNYKGLVVPKHNYIGIDIVENNNVDIVVDEYDWEGLPDGSADFVISGQTFNYMTDPKSGIMEVERILCNEGMACVIVPEVQVNAAPSPFTLDLLEELIQGTTLINISCSVILGDLVLIVKKEMYSTKKSELQKKSGIKKKKGFLDIN